MTNHTEVVRDVVEYIESHLDEKLTLARVAQAVHYSRYHLHRVFARAAGMTVHDYLVRRQLTEAARLLTFTKRPILDIALLCGYESQQAFTSRFTAMYKQTPRLFRKRKVFYPLQLPLRLRQSQPISRRGLRSLTVESATSGDVQEWMDLVRLTVDGFPHLDDRQYRRVLEREMDLGHAHLVRQQTQVVGVMLFTPGSGSIDFLAVHPLYRRRGVARALLGHALGKSRAAGGVQVTTFREGDAADNGSRAACKRLGFTEGELLTEFGYPTQRFTLSKEDNNG